MQPFVLFLVVVVAFALAYLGLTLSHRLRPTATSPPPPRVIIHGEPVRPPGYRPPIPSWGSAIDLEAERRKRRPNVHDYRPPDGGGAGAAKAA